MPEIRSLCVYCGSNPGRDPAYADATADLARVLASRGIRVIYGGGAVGLMGRLADEALAAGAEVVGIMPQHLVDREIGHHGLTELRVVASMHERKALMAELADAFVALPGGAGTLEELVEVYTWAQLGLHRKPIGLLDVDGYYAPFVTFLDRAVDAGFIRPEHRAMLLVDDRPQDLLERLATAVTPVVPKWLSLSER